MSGAPPYLTDLKAFVDCCCNKDFGDTRRELDTRVGPVGSLPIYDRMNAVEYAYNQLLIAFEEARLLTRRAMEVNRRYQGDPVTVTVLRWQAQLYRATGKLQYLEESWLKSSNELQLRHCSVGYIVAKWVRESINGRLRRAILNVLELQSGVRGLSNMLNTDTTHDTITFQ